MNRITKSFRKLNKNYRDHYASHPKLHTTVSLTILSLLSIFSVILVFLTSNVSPTATKSLRNLQAHADTGAGFHIVSSPNPSASNNTLQAVSSYDASHTWAVGSYQNTDGSTHDLIEYWNGVTWTQQTGANPGVNGNYLSGVKAFSATNIWAVGSYVDANFNPLVLIEHSTDGGQTWKQDTPSYIGTYTGLGYLTALDGDPSSGDAWAVGYTGSGSALTFHLENGHFVQKPNVSQIPNITLSGLSELSSSDVWAVGSHINGIYTFTMHYDGSSWTTYPSPNLNPFSGYNFLTGVTEIAPNDAWAVGTTLSGPITTGFLIHWNGSAWSTTPITVQVATNTASSLQAVTATSSNDIWAAGGYYDFGANREYLLIWHSLDGGSTWAQVPAESPINDAYFLGITRDTATGSMWAVGSNSYIQSGNFYTNTLIEQNNPMPTPTPTPARQIVFVHGINTNFKDAQKCTDINGNPIKGFQSIWCGSAFESNTKVFTYYQDLAYKQGDGSCKDNLGNPQPTPDTATGPLYAHPDSINPTICDSQSAIAYNSTGFRDFLTTLTGPVAIINYSMGAAITRGWLTLAQSIHDNTLNIVDTIISIQGAQKGSYLALPGEGLTTVSGFFGKLKTQIVTLAKQQWGIDPTRPAAKDLIPFSFWYASANLTNVPSYMHYFNLYSDIQLTIHPKILTIPLPAFGPDELGDLVLLPGDPNPTALLSTFPNGGSRFLPGGSPIDRHEFLASSNLDLPFALNLNLQQDKQNFNNDVNTVLNDPIAHLNLNKHLSDGTVLINSCAASNGQASPSVEILRILNNPAQACDSGGGQ